VSQTASETVTTVTATAATAQAGTTASALYILREGVVVRIAPDQKEERLANPGHGESPLMFGQVRTFIFMSQSALVCVACDTLF
jgi:hypothetical protein